MSGKRNGKKTKRHKRLAANLIAGVIRPIARRLSYLVDESLKQPGSWRCLEIIYRNEPRKLLDYLFLSSSSVKGTRNRLRIFQEEIYKCVHQYSQISNPVSLINFGSGPGYEILGCMERLKNKVAVKATCIDREPSALEHGRDLALQKGLSNCVRYIQGNVLRMNSTNAEYHVGILSGILDYFDFETAVSVLKQVSETLIPGGTVLIANMRRHRLESTMKVLGNWNLVYREPEDVGAILRESGYGNIEVWLEPEKVFCIGKAKRHD